MVALWSILFIVTIVLFIAVHAVILPKLFFKADGKAPVDSGLKIIKEINGQSIIYEPEAGVRQYIKKYILSERDGKKLFICNIDKNISNFDYDVAAYGENGECLKVLNVKEEIQKSGYTRVAELPKKTAYVTVAVNSVNGEIVKKQKDKRLIKRTALYIVASSFFDVLGIVCLKVCTAKLFGGLFGESFISLSKTWLLTAAICAAAVILNVVFTVVVVRFKKLSQIKGGAKNA